MKYFKSGIIGAILRNRFTYLLVLVLLQFTASAQVRFVTIVSENKIGIDDPFKVQYIVENAEEISRFNEPDFRDFTILQGPNHGSSTTITNGEVSRQLFVSYILKANSKGKLKVPGAQAIINGKKLNSGDISITVVEGSLGGTRSGGVRGQFNRIPIPQLERRRRQAEAEKDFYLKPGESPQEKITKNLFVKSECDKSECYVGEPIVATYKLYSRLQSQSRVSQFPSFNGFSVFDMMDPGSSKQYKEEIDGKEFTVNYIRHAQLFPLQPGEFTIDPVVVDNNVVFLKKTGTPQPGSGDSFEDIIREFFNDQPLGETEEHRVALSSKPINIKVKPLPEDGRPAYFSGAVGKFNVESSVSGSVIKSGDVVTLTVKITGKGNLPMITAPEISWPAGFEGFDPTSSENLDKTTAPISGSLVFTYPFTLSDTGSHIIPAVNFSYFDPGTNQYNTVSTQPISLKVLPGVNAEKTNPAPLALKIPEPATGNSIFEQHYWIKILMGLAIALLAVIAYVSFRNRTPKAVEVIRTGQTVSVATPVAGEPAGSVRSTSGRPTVTNRWEAAEKKLAENDSKGFYKETGSALWGFLSEFLQLKGTELNKAAVMQKLSPYQISSETLKNLVTVLNECELALYTPIHSAEDMEAILTKAKAVVACLEKK